MSRLHALMPSTAADPTLFLARNLLVGVTADLLRDAELLAQYGLRASQITRLTGLPQSCIARLVTSAGGVQKTGRHKASVRELLKHPAQHILAAAFLHALSPQLDAAPDVDLRSGAVLAAIRSLDLRMPRPGGASPVVDWERLVNAAFQLAEGKILLRTCSMCGTRHLTEPGVSPRAAGCILCRLGYAMTERTKAPPGRTSVTPFRVAECRSFPASVPAPAECRKRIQSMLSGGAGQ